MNSDYIANKSLSHRWFKSEALRAEMFSFEGRIGRFSWWICQVGVVVATLILEKLLPLFAKFGSLGAIFVFGIGIVLFWIAIANNARRWHDRNKSGWWSLLYIAAYIPSFVFAASMSYIPPQYQGACMIVAVVATVTILLWPLVELGFLSGTDGANKYGARSL